MRRFAERNNASTDLINDISSFCKIDNRAFKTNTFIDRIKEVKSNEIYKNVSTDIIKDKEFFLNIFQYNYLKTENHDKFQLLEFFSG